MDKVPLGGAPPGGRGQVGIPQAVTTPSSSLPGPPALWLRAARPKLRAQDWMVLGEGQSPWPSAPDALSHSLDLLGLKSPHQP